MEVEVAAATPADEVGWHIESVCVASHPNEVACEPATIMELSAFVAEAVPVLSAIPWRHARVFATSNFARCLKGQVSAVGTAGMEAYLRMVDMLLLFPREQAVLLLSDREGDRVLALYQRMCRVAAPASVVRPVLCHLTYLQAEAASAVGPSAATPSPSRLQLPANGNVSTGQVTVAALKLFSGETTFGPGTSDPRAALRQLLPTRAAAEAAVSVPPARGTAHLLDRSDLEEECAAVTVALFNARQTVVV